MYSSKPNAGKLPPLRNCKVTPFFTTGKIFRKFLCANEFTSVPIFPSRLCHANKKWQICIMQ